jgi:hypothetical protein
MFLLRTMGAFSVVLEFSNLHHLATPKVTGGVLVYLPLLCSQQVLECLAH